MLRQQEVVYQSILDRASNLRIRAQAIDQAAIAHSSCSYVCTNVLLLWMFQLAALADSAINIRNNETSLQLTAESKRIAEESKHIAEESKNVAEASKEIAEATRKDIIMMRTIAVVTMVFVPATFTPVWNSLLQR